MKHIKHEYGIWFWSNERHKYIFKPNSVRSSYAECLHDFELQRKNRASWEYPTCDWNNFEIRYRKVVTTDWEVIHD